MKSDLEEEAYELGVMDLVITEYRAPENSYWTLIFSGLIPITDGPPRLEQR